MRIVTRHPLIAAVVLFGTIAGCWRAYRAVVPAAADFWPFLAASHEGPTLVSPDGTRIIRLYFNDAGAMHSGHHWTWLVTDDWLWGKYVLVAGYSTFPVSCGREPFVFEWQDD